MGGGGGFGGLVTIKGTILDVFSGMEKIMIFFFFYLNQLVEKFNHTYSITLSKIKIMSALAFRFCVQRLTLWPKRPNGALERPDGALERPNGALERPNGAVFS